MRLALATHCEDPQRCDVVESVLALASRASQGAYKGIATCPQSALGCRFRFGKVPPG